VIAKGVPHSLEAEQSVLGGLLLDSTALERARPLHARQFFDGRHGAIFSAIQSLAVSGSVADVITVFERLQANGKHDECGGLPYLNALAQSVPSAANIRQYAEIVREKATLRDLLSAADQVRTVAQGAKDVQQAISQAREIIADVAAFSGHAAAVRPRTLDLRQLAHQKAPARQWFIPNWLGDGPSLFAAAGGVGKTLLAQQAATAGAMGRGFIGDVARPFRSLLWACEDDADELWRRQEAISEHFDIALDAPADNLVIQSRRGVDNVLMAPAYGELQRTNVFEELRQQVNDLAVDVLWLDNVAHLFGGDENVRGQVTTFINAMAGLVAGRQFAVVLLAHTARQTGSEFAGSAAWENAVRMRWYLGTKLPDQKGDEAACENADARFLAKRKTNYSVRDYVRFTMSDGVLVPDLSAADRVGGSVSQLDERRAEQLVIAGFKSLQGMGITPTDGKNSPDYLPKQMLAKGLGAGFGAMDLGRAMNRLMGRGVFARGQVGHYSNRNPKLGLVLQQQGD
jgi:hypothetical protein